MVDRQFWNKKQVFVTGRTGFKGGRLSTHPECARGARWDDKAFEIEWPLAMAIISDKDRSYSDFDETVLQ